ncbi:hypothetical protein BDV37DRAFT_52499 [Aspergillus pseudonomiae]|uniref:Uncharacterized protein n=1 Tax=Aspergillus pseudonomiae TaxID=1506151 RepID=A0A5N7DKD3_9EURO|nr:uncharacterized protein BDV37DRAFT_52499 [Aspergillus pseudonomiae]KAE8406745.1 hypothetical protein BDV37DRAFT_52499 [Aspergillus pseudonomiae]
MSAPSFAELEAAASSVIDILKTMSEFSNVKIAVIGGLGLWKYLRGYRTTEFKERQKQLKINYLPCPPVLSNSRRSFFFYRSSNGKHIQVDITPDWQSPYILSAAGPISAVRPGSLPYISETDLLIFKINSCGLRSTPAKKLRDATDARSLADDLSSKGPIVLSSTQKSAVLQGLDDVVRLSGKTGLGESPNWH